MTRLLVLTLVGSLALAPDAIGVEPGRAAATRAPDCTQNRATQEEISADLARMQAGLAQAGSALAQGAAMYQRYDQQLAGFLQLAARAGTGDAAALAQLPAATKQMEETRMSFNLQYLQLQRQMQNENRQYTTISNVMKTKR
ncbi:MAG: hypothetical protein FJ191_01695 [Gammaproteobacteria bacterium]|nr:hypothetical protein [Gammaproteobacteria bacterium]